MSGSGGDHVDYMRRATVTGACVASQIVPAAIWAASSMEQLSTELRQTRQLVNASRARDLRRGFTLTLLVLLGAAWLVSLVPLLLIAHRVSRPIQQLTAG